MASADRHSYLCIGGPLDGQRLESKGPRNFQVPVLAGRQSFDGDSRRSLEEATPAAPSPISRVNYTLTTFRDEEGDVYFWRPEGDTVAKSLERLLESYQRNALTAALAREGYRR